MKPKDKNIAGYYDVNPESISSPFGGVGSWYDEHLYLDEVLRDLGIDIEGKRVLDVGCGSGWFASYCKGKVKHYTGVDIADRCIKLTRKVTDSVIKASGEQLPFDGGSFDYVFFIDSFEHIPSQERATAEAYRVLDKDGKVFVSVPNYSNVCGLVKRFEESVGFYEKDSWAPFNSWAPQALEYFMTPQRVRTVFTQSGFKDLKMIGGHDDLLDGIFPWIDHRFMFGAKVIRKVFSLVEKPLTRMFPRLSLHNFWLIGK